MNDINRINELKRCKNAVILAHYYQNKEVQDIADFIGDSLELAQKALSVDCEIIVFSGVKFMAETAKILNPSKRVLLPDIYAGCSLADTCTVGEFKKFRDRYPEHVVVSYINTYTEIKAMSDFICTSSNAEKIIRSIPETTGIIFVPDMNLGKYLIKKTNRDMVLWPGSCTVHEKFSLEKIRNIKQKYPDSQVIAHPECGYQVLEEADFIGSTSKLLNFVINNNANTFIVVTEEGIIHQMKRACPEKIFIPAPPVHYTDCSCSECPYMKLNTLEKIILCLQNEIPEILISENLRLNALRPLNKMLAASMN